MCIVFYKRMGVRRYRETDLFRFLQSCKLSDMRQNYNACRENTFTATAFDTELLSGFPKHQTFRFTPNYNACRENTFIATAFDAELLSGFPTA